MNRAWRHTFPLTALFPSAIPIGSQRVRAICPDPKHAETHPSCVVNYDSTHGWKWHCFACGADGDALDVLTGREGMGFTEAIGVLSRGLASVGPKIGEVPRGADRSSPAGDSPRYRLLSAGVPRTDADGVQRSEGRELPRGGLLPADGASNHRLILVCDACRNETAEFSKRRYGRDGRAWTSSADLELATLPGWELSAGLQFAIGPKCLERIA